MVLLQIIDPFQVIVALMAALNNLKNDKLLTKNLSSEVLLSLSASRNVIHFPFLVNFVLRKLQNLIYPFFIRFPGP